MSGLAPAGHLKMVYLERMAKLPPFVPHRLKPGKLGWEAIKRGCWIAGLACLLFAQVQAASFDCGKATAQAEKIICSEADISALDDELAELYAETLAWHTDTAGLLKDREQALKWRQDPKVNCSNRACLLWWYQTQIARLCDIRDIQSEQCQAAKKVAETRRPGYEEPVCKPARIDWRNYEWTLIVGNGTTACEEMLAYLKSRPKDEPPPICQDERLPSNGHWSRPDWKEVPKERRQALLRQIPVKYNTYPNGDKNVLKTARVDITRDGIPETLLNLESRYPADCRPQSICWKNPVRPEWDTEDVRVTGGVWQKLLPLDETGTRVDLKRRDHWGGLLGSYQGEIVFYKGRPYWLSNLFWSQEMADNFRHNRTRPNDPFSRIFELAPLSYLKLDHGDPKTPADFNSLLAILPDGNAACYFGYFHHDNLKLNPSKKWRYKSQNQVVKKDKSSNATIAVEAKRPSRENGVCGIVEEQLKRKQSGNDLPNFIIDWVEIDGGSDLFKNIDLDRDGINDKLVRSCGAGLGATCFLFAELSAGNNFEFEEEHFFLVRINHDIYMIVGAKNFGVTGSRGNTIRVYLITKSNTRQVCSITQGGKP